MDFVPEQLIAGAAAVRASSSSPRGSTRAGWGWATSSSPACSGLYLGRAVAPGDLRRPRRRRRSSAPSIIARARAEGRPQDRGPVRAVPRPRRRGRASSSARRDGRVPRPLLAASALRGTSSPSRTPGRKVDRRFQGFSRGLIDADAGRAGSPSRDPEPSITWHSARSRSSASTSIPSASPPPRSAVRRPHRHRACGLRTARAGHRARRRGPGRRGADRGAQDASTARTRAWTGAFASASPTRRSPCARSSFRPSRTARSSTPRCASRRRTRSRCRWTRRCWTCSRSSIVETPEGPRQRVLLVAARRDMVDRVVAAVRAAGLRLEGIDLAAFAMIRALHRRRAPTSEPVLYLGVGGLTNLAVAAARSCLFTRVSAAASRRSPSSSPSAARSRSSTRAAGSSTSASPRRCEDVEGDEEIVSEARAVLQDGVRRIGAEVRRRSTSTSMQVDGSPVSRVVLTGDAVGVAGFAEALGAELGLPVEAGRVDGAPAGIDARAPDRRRRPRGRGGSPHEAVNLIPRRGAPRRRQPPGAAAAPPTPSSACSPCSSSWPPPGRSPEGRQRQAGRPRATVDQQATATEAQADEPRRLHRLLRPAREARRDRQAIADSRFDWAHALHEVARTIPQDAWLTSLDGTVAPTAAAPAAAPARCAARSPARGRDRRLHDRPGGGLAHDQPTCASSTASSASRLESSEKADAGGAAAAAAARHATAATATTTVPKFQITAWFAALAGSRGQRRAADRPRRRHGRDRRHAAAPAASATPAAGARAQRQARHDHPDHGGSSLVTRRDRNVADRRRRCRR